MRNPLNKNGDTIRHRIPVSFQKLELKLPLRDDDILAVDPFAADDKILVKVRMLVVEDHAHIGVDVPVEPERECLGRLNCLRRMKTCPRSSESHESR